MAMITQWKEGDCPTCGQRYKDPRHRACEHCGGDVAIYEDPDERCVVCHANAPKRPGRSATSHRMALVPQMDGWMRIFFPWPKNSNHGPIMESQWLCVGCGTEIAKFIAHRRTPMIDDEDLTG